MNNWGDRKEKLALLVASLTRWQPPEGRSRLTHIRYLLLTAGVINGLFAAALLGTSEITFRLLRVPEAIGSPLVLLGSGVLVAAPLGRLAWRGLDTYESQESQRMVVKVGRLRKALAEAAQLSEELSAELAARMATLNRIQAEAENWEQLAAVKQTEAQAVTRLVRAEVEGGVRHLDRMGWFFAMLGWMAAILAVVFESYIPVFRR